MQCPEHEYLWTESPHLQSKFDHVLTRATSNQPEGEIQIVTIRTKVQGPTKFKLNSQKKKNLTNWQYYQYFFLPTELQFNRKTHVYTAKLVFLFNIYIFPVK